MAESHAAEEERVEKNAWIFISYASPDQLLIIAKYMHERIHEISLMHLSKNLDEASNLSGDLVLDLACAIQDIKGDK